MSLCENCVYAIFDSVPYGSTNANYLSGCELEDEVPEEVIEDENADCPFYKENRMKCEDCDYSEIVDWVQDAKTGKATPLYWCERRNKTCKDMQEFKENELKGE